VAKRAVITMEDDREITSLHFSICTGASGDDDHKQRWSFVTLDSILKYCAPQSAERFMESLVTVSKEVMSAKDAEKEAAGDGQGPRRPGRVTRRHTV
jgi:hypothetical protein